MRIIEAPTLSSEEFPSTISRGGIAVLLASWGHPVLPVDCFGQPWVDQREATTDTARIAGHFVKHLRVGVVRDGNVIVVPDYFDSIESVRSWTTTVLVDTTPQSDPEAWSRYERRRRAVFCPWYILLVDSQLRVWDYEKPCNSWSHQSCAETRLPQELAHYAKHFLKNEEIWVTFPDPDDTGLNGRLSTARSRLRRKGETVDSVTVRREDGQVYVFATTPQIGGRTLPEADWVSFSPAVAAVLLRAVTALPGLKGSYPFSPSSGWERTSEKTKGSAVMIMRGVAPRAADLLAEMEALSGGELPKDYKSFKKLAHKAAISLKSPKALGT